MRIRYHYIVVLAMLFASITHAADEKPTSKPAPDYHKDILPILNKYCLGCHSGREPDGEVRLDSYKVLTAKHENQLLITPKKSVESRLVKLIERTVEPAMPPEDEPAPTKNEIAILKRWIDAGAHGDDSQLYKVRLANLPKIPLKKQVAAPIRAMHNSPGGKILAVASQDAVELIDARNEKSIRKLSEIKSSMNDVEFSSNGEFLLAAGGEPGLYGELICWRTSDWSKTQQILAHDDSILTVATSPDGKLIATGSYDQTIIIWEFSTMKQLGVLTGHNGAVNDVEFSPNGKFLGSASSDRTVKLWDVKKLERLDTFTQPEKEQYTLAFTPDGKHLASGGVDNRIRIWRISDTGSEGSNPILFARFAHDAPIVKLAFSIDGKWLISSGEDRFIKLWETNAFTQRDVFPRQSDWSTAVTFNPLKQSFHVGRHDGSREIYTISSSIAKNPVAEPLATNLVPISDATVTEMTKTAEVEPNNVPEHATKITIPTTATGVLNSKSTQADVDLFRISAKAGKAIVLETRAARMKSPVDSKIEVLDSKGQKVQRLKFRAVRDSYITFRPVDSSRNDIRAKNWGEMDLREWMYMDGEICRIFRMPEGPDSGFRFFEVGGKRRNYFDTSGIAHALGDPCYIVEPYAVDAELVDNGLPVFPLYFENDDDGNRKLGSDSHLIFTPLNDGEYIVKVSDVRGFQGENFKYELIARPAKPDYSVSLSSKNPKIGKGSGQSFNINVNRTDDFEGEVTVQFENVPDGIHITSPITIQEGHLFAEGVISIEQDAHQPTAEQSTDIKVTATAIVHGKAVKKSIANFGTITLDERPKLIVHLLPDDGTKADQYSYEKIPEIIVTPGTMSTAMLRLERHGFNGEIKFDAKNLPHGMIVDNIGLSGVLIRNGENERQIFLNCREWVPEQSRLVHAVTKGQGNQATRPVWIHVRRKNPENGSKELATQITQ